MSQRRRMRPDIRRKQILDTAVRFFRTVGYEAASLRDLAADVGINKATIYHYFKSKEEILFHIIDDVGESLLRGLREARARNADPLDGLEAMVRFQIGYMEGHLEEIKVLVEEQKSLGSELAERTRVTQGKILELYERTLTECMDKGLVRRVHLATAAFSILGHINWLYQWYKPTGALTIRQLTEEIVSILREGLFLRKGGQGEG
jgi:AcrR family transcriptional regulator